MRNSHGPLALPARLALAGVVVATSTLVPFGLASAGVVAAPSGGTFINAGGGSVTDAAGRVWSADTGAVAGRVATTKQRVGGPGSGEVYRTAREGMAGYDIPVPASGTYTVELGFAELVWGEAGKRVFSIDAEGKRVVSDLDLFATAGQLTPVTRSVDVPVSDGVLNLRFVASADLPTVSSLSVSPTASAAPAPTPTASAAPAPTPTASAAPAPTAGPAPSGAACTTTMSFGANLNSFINGLAAGAVGCLPGGTYTGANVEMATSGTSTEPITIQSVPGQRAKLMMRMAVTGAFVTFRTLSFDTDHKLGTSNTWVKSGAHDLTFSENLFANSGLTGTTAHDGQCLYSDSGSYNVRILRNRFTGCGSLDQFHHAMYVNGTGYTIANNLVVGTKAFGIHLYPSLNNSLVTNNTVVGSGRSGIIVATSSTGNRVVNNIVSGNASYGIEGYANTGSNTVADNICFRNSAGCVESGQGFTGSGNTEADPRFVNASGGDYTVAAGSPAIDSGDSAAVGPDFNGAARPLGAGPDKGAFER